MRTLIRSSPLYRVMLSGDDSMASVVLILEPTGESFDPKARLVRETRAVVERLRAGRPAVVAGGPRRGGPRGEVRDEG